MVNKTKSLLLATENCFAATTVEELNLTCHLDADSCDVARVVGGEKGTDISDLCRTNSRETHTFRFYQVEQTLKGDLEQ